MKKIVLVSLLITGLFAGKKADNAKVLSSDIQTTVIEFKLDDFNLVPVQTPNGIMHLARLDNGASILKQGAPDIHKISRSIIVPDNADMKIDIISSQFSEYENISIAPSKGNLSRLTNPVNVPYEFGSEYSKDAFFPSTVANLQDPYILKNLRGQTVDFYPIQYNPIQKLLRVYTEITVKVYAEGESGVNVLQRKSGKQVIAREYKNIYEGHFLNFSSDNRFDYLDDHGNMLIISYGSFMEEMQPLVNWKNRKGVPTEMVNVSDIGTSSSAIANYVDNYYYENGLTFLLLVGDVAQIPTPSISGSASDPSYGFIEGNDSYAEVIVGRFSGSTPAHIATQVERSIEYERSPQSGGDWYDNAMGVASNQGPGFGGYTDDDFNDMLWNDILSDFTYDSYQYSYDGSGGSVSQGMGVINSGVSLINYTGHGSQSSWGNGAALSTSNVNSLTNSDMLPFIISVACNNGEFNTTNECFGESWLRATNNAEPSGGVGFYGSTISMSWEPPMHGQYAMNLILTESYENHITRSMGGITTNGCLYMNDAQGSSGTNETNYWTLFGDPSLELRTDQPSTLNVSHDGAIVVGQSELVVNTGVDNALVAISKDNELLAFAYSENGSANLNLDNTDLLPGDYDLVVTSFNAFPYETTVSVITPDGPYVTLDSFEINDNSGNNNGMADFDEHISLELQANNVGVDDAHNVYAAVSIDDPYISLYVSNISFGDISAGSSANSTSNIEFDISHNVPDGHSAGFDILFFSDEDQWEGNFNITIHAPVLTVSNPSFTDAGGDGVWDAGESIDVVVLLNNEGSADHMMYPGVGLTESSPDAAISDDGEFFWFYGIAAGTSVPAYFTVIASDDANMGTEVTFTAQASEMNCEENCIEGEPFSFTFTIGLPFDDSLHEPLNLTAESSENSIDLSWDEPFTCPDGQFADCIGQCIDDWYEAWLGDGLCDDGTWGVYFNCDEFNNDGGDCGDVLTCEDQGMVTCPNGICEESVEDCPDTSCEPGYIDDCSGDGDCCPESWIGDGFADCEDQAYGCDLTCYDNDGGDCGGRNDSSNEKIGQMYPSRLNADFSDAVIIPLEARDVDGYFVYRDGTYIAFTDELGYNDSDINAGSEYCYHITAVYEEGQSGPSNTACATAEGDPGMDGDLNGDGALNILDIVTMVNIVLAQEYLLSADLNGDGHINIQDIILLVNMVVGGRTIHSDENIGTKAQIYQEDSSVFISSDGKVGGIQMTLEHDGGFNIELTDRAMVAEYRTIGNETILVIVEPESDKLFSYTGDYTVTSVIAANILSAAMELELTARILPDVFELSQNFPNPFNPNTQIQFVLGKDELVSLNIFDIQGRLVNSLINNSNYPAGYHNITWNGTNTMGTQVPSGMYLYKLVIENQTITRKMVLMK
ncbi:MAG: C25 family cysteine peptidase [Candidatus Marinimicrobia bacterium]|nr:C25 family cysteine peptidase [Candidatus Neomarinimicrobiota bacterium]